MSAAPSTLALLTMLSRSVYRTAAERKGSSSAKLKHFVALSYLRELGEVGQTAFGRVLCLDANNTVLLLNQLEADGLIVRTRCEQDRRRHLIRLTETGSRVLIETETSMGDLEDELLTALDTDQRSRLRELLHLTLYGAGGPFDHADVSSTTPDPSLGRAGSLLS